MLRPQTLAIFALLSLAACGASPGGEDTSSTASPLGFCPPGTVRTCSGDGPQGQMLCECDPLPPPSPQNLATTSGPPDSVATDGSNVYFGTDDGKVMSCPVTGCGYAPPTVLAAAPGRATHLLVDAQNVYWLQVTDGNAAIMTCPKAGGVPSALVPYSMAVSIAIDASNIYWSNNTWGYSDGSSSIESCPKTGCNGKPTVVAGGRTDPTSLAVDSTGVYWLEGDPETNVATCPTTGCGSSAPKWLALDVLKTAEEDAIALDASNVYVVGEGSLVRCSKTGCPGGATTLVSGGPVPTWAWDANVIAVDGTNVYWSTSHPPEAATSTAGSLLKCAVSGCGGAPTTIASSTDPFWGVALDATHVYWADHGSTQGAVMRIAKSL